MASEPTTTQLANPAHLAPALVNEAAPCPAANFKSRADATEPNDLAPAGTTPVASVATSTGWLRALLGLCLFYGVFYLGAWTSSRSVKPPLAGPFTTNATPNSAPAVVVHVAGAVAHPGVYHLPFDARITDAIHEAGGALPNADTNALNLAAWVEDGTKIEVPTIAAPVATASQIAATQPPPQPAAVARPAPAIAPLPAAKVSRPKSRTPKTASIKADAAIPHAITPSGTTSKKIDPAYLSQHPINVNTAPATDLQELPGIGPAMAAKIITYRQENGRFQAVDDLRNVKGIGEKKLAKLQPLVTVK